MRTVITTHRKQYKKRHPLRRSAAEYQRGYNDGKDGWSVNRSRTDVPYDTAYWRGWLCGNAYGNRSRSPR